MLWMVQRAAALVFMLVSVTLVAPAALAGKASEAYVQSLAGDAIAIINNSALSAPEKDAQLSKLLDASIDVKTIGLFTLGQHRRTASELDLAGYQAAFHDYLIAYYVKNLGRLSSATFKVTGSSELSNGRGAVVNSTASGDSGEPIDMKWRVVNDNSIQDVQIGGVWMALSLREQMATVIGNNQSISAATGKLKEITAGLAQGR